MKLFQYLGLAEVPPASKTGTNSWKEVTSPDKFLPNEVPASLVRRTGLALRRQNVFALTAALTACAISPLPPAITNVQQFGSFLTPNASSVTFTFQPLRAGDFLTVFVQAEAAGLPATDTLDLTAPGWTFAKSISEFGPGGLSQGITCCFTAFAPNANNTTFTIRDVQGTTLTNVSRMVDEWRDVDTVTPVDNFSRALTNGTQTVNLTPVANNCAIVGADFDNVGGVGTIGGVAAAQGCNDAHGDWTIFRVLNGGAGVQVAVTPSGNGVGVMLAMSIRPVGSPAVVVDIDSWYTSERQFFPRVIAKRPAVELFSCPFNVPDLDSWYTAERQVVVHPVPRPNYLFQPSFNCPLTAAPAVNIDKWEVELSTPVPRQKSRASTHPILSDYIPLTTPSINVRFKGNSSFDIGPTEVAGVVPKANWLNAIHIANSYSSLPDENGNLTSVALSFNADSVWAETIADAPGNVRIMEGYLEDSFGTSPTATFTGLPPGAYDVYIYAQGATSPTRAGSYQISGTGISTAAKIITDLGGTQFDGTFTEASNSAGNYCVFTVTTVGDITITATPTTADDGVFRCPLNAIQLIPKQVGSTYVQPTGWQPDVAASRPLYRRQPLPVGDSSFFVPVNVPDLDSWAAQLSQPLKSLRPVPADFQSFVPVTTAPVVNIDSWAVELSVPVRPAKRLIYAFPTSHEFVAVNVPDSDSWTPQIAQPLFKGKPLPVGDPAFFVAINVPDLDSWVSQLSTPVFRQPSLRVGDAAFFVAINVPDLDSWVSPLPLPVLPAKRQAHTYPASFEIANTAPEKVSADRWAPELARPVFRAKAQPHTYPYAFDVSIQTAPIFVDKWLPALDVPAPPRRRTIAQDSAFVAINVPDLDSWVSPLSQPVYRAAPLRVGEAAFFVPVNVPDLDSWVQQLSTPAYPQKRVVAEGAFVPVVAVTLSFVPNDAQPLVLQRRPIPEISSLAPVPQNLSFLPNDVQPIRATRGTVREQYAFVQVVIPSVDSWATELSVPTYLGRRQPHTYPTTFEVSAQTAPVFIDKWSVELPRPVFDLRRSQHSFSFVADVPNTAKELVSADRWTNPLSVPIFPQKRIITEGSAFVTFIPAPAVDPDKYAPELSRPTWYPKRTQYTYPCAFDVPNPAPERTSPDRWAFELGRPTWYPRRFQHTYPSTAFDVANTARERTTVDKWWQELSVPVPLRKRSVAEASFFTPLNVPRLDSWATQLSTPVFRTRPVAQHDASALVPINVPDLDSWATQLSTPVFRTRSVAQHDASALVTNIVSLSFLPNDVQSRRVVGQGYLSTVSDPVQVPQNLSFLPSDVLPRQKSNGVVPEISAFVPTVARKVTVDSWAVDLCVPTPIAKGRTHGYPSSFEVPSTLANFVPIDRWASGLSVPIFQQRRTIVGGEVSAPIAAQSTAPFSFLPNYVQPTPRQVRAATSQTFDVVSTSSETVSVDRWVSQLSTPIFPQKIVVVETSFFIQTAAIPPVPGLSFLPNDIQVIRPPFNGYFLPFVSEHIFVGQTIVSGPLILLDPINGYPRNNSAINGRTRVNSVVDGIPRINAAIDGAVRTNEVVDGAPRINSILPSPQPKDI